VGAPLPCCSSAGSDESDESDESDGRGGWLIYYPPLPEAIAVSMVPTNPMRDEMMVPDKPTMACCRGSIHEGARGAFGHTVSPFRVSDAAVFCQRARLTFANIQGKPRADLRTSQNLTSPAWSRFSRVES